MAKESKSKDNGADEVQTHQPAQTKRPSCGLVMPISECDSLPPSHWLEVKSIVSDAIGEAGFEASLVSDSDAVSVIQKEIVQRLYDDPIVVVDVSGKNANVMFELGIRLAFDKPTVIIKDDQTTYSFDTSPIKHIPYPRDLRFSGIIGFQSNLAKAVKSTAEAGADPNYSTFLKHFGKFTVPKLQEQEVSRDDYIISQLKEIRHELRLRDADIKGRAGRTFAMNNEGFWTEVEEVLPSSFLSKVASVMKDMGWPLDSARVLSIAKAVIERSGPQIMTSSSKSLAEAIQDVTKRQLHKAESPLVSPNS